MRYRQRIGLALLIVVTSPMVNVRGWNYWTLYLVQFIGLVLFFLD